MQHNYTIRMNKQYTIIVCALYTHVNIYMNNDGVSNVLYKRDCVLNMLPRVWKLKLDTYLHLLLYYSPRDNNLFGSLKVVLIVEIRKETRFVKR